MQRRTAVKQLLFIAGGVAFLPACVHGPTEASIPLKKLHIKSDGEKLLAEIGETLIPKTAIPGAKDLYTHLFALRMLDDCYTTEQQQQFEKGLTDINAFAKTKYNNGFSDCTMPQRTALLTELDGRKKGEPLYDFYQMTKALTIQGYLQSKYVLTNITKYELVPGRYNGFAPVKTVYHQI